MESWNSYRAELIINSLDMVEKKEEERIRLMAEEWEEGWPTISGGARLEA